MVYSSKSFDDINNHNKADTIDFILYDGNNWVPEELSCPGSHSLVAELEFELKKSGSEGSTLNLEAIPLLHLPLIQKLTPLLESGARIPSLTSWQVVILISIWVLIEMTRT